MVRRQIALLVPAPCTRTSGSPRPSSRMASIAGERTWWTGRGTNAGGPQRASGAYHRAVSTEPGDTCRATHYVESKLWVQQLRSGHPRHEEAVGKLRGVLVGIAFDELSRRRGQLGAPAGPEDDELAQQAADAALMNIPGERLEQREQLEALSAAIAKLGDRQREVFVAVALNDVSVDVLALQL